MSYSSMPWWLPVYFTETSWFIRYVQSINDVEELPINAIYVLAKALGMGLTASELMKYRKVGFTNQKVY